jgi:hypothetical protein
LKHNIQYVLDDDEYVEMADRLHAGLKPDVQPPARTPDVQVEMADRLHAGFGSLCSPLEIKGASRVISMSFAVLKN